MRNSLEQLKQEYLNTIKNAGTQQSYKSILNKIDTLDVQKLSTLLIEIKKERKNNYAALAYRVVKQFLRFVEDFEKINLQVSKLTNIKVEKEIKTALTDHQMNLIYDIAKNSRDAKFCFFLAFMRENVCRISEAIKVINDVDKWETKNGETTQINQANKNGNYRVFRIPNEWEDKWKTFVPFVKETIQKQLTRFSSYLKREWAKDLDGISLKSHDYRTAGVTALFTNGTSLEDIALVTGHKSLGVLRNTYVNADRDYMLSLLNVANTGAFKYLREAEANKELKKLKSEYMKLEKRAQGNYDQLKKISTNYAKVKSQLIETKEENKKLKNEIKELTEYISIILEAYNPEDKETVMLDKIKQLNQFIKGVKNV